jgi:hypothetical protein
MTRLRIAASSRVPPQTACQTGTPPTRFGKSRPASTAHGLTTTVPTRQILPIVYENANHHRLASLLLIRQAADRRKAAMTNPGGGRRGPVRSRPLSRGGRTPGAWGRDGDDGQEGSPSLADGGSLPSAATFRCPKKSGLEVLEARLDPTGPGCDDGNQLARLRAPRGPIDSEGVSEDGRPHDRLHPSRMRERPRHPSVSAWRHCAGAYGR